MSQKALVKTCFLLATLTLALAFLTILILCTTIFKPKPPSIVTTPVTLHHLDFSLLPNLHINLTLALDILIKNPNYVGFRHENTKMYVYYDGIVVGKVPVVAGSVGARSEKMVRTNFELFVDKLVLNLGVWRDVVDLGCLRLISSTSLHGQVVVLGMFKLHAVTHVTCYIQVFLHDKRVGSYCDTQIKF